MTSQHSVVSRDHFDRHLYTTSQTAERVLNAAIVETEISESFEEYLEIFDAFYADDLEVSSDTPAAPIRGKASVRSLLLDFPLHVMAEIGGLSVSIRECEARELHDKMLQLHPDRANPGSLWGSARAAKESK
jgi:hypothetical protein